MLDSESIVQMIGNFGFPIVITIYLLHRFENRIENLESAIRSLADVVGKNK